MNGDEFARQVKMNNSILPVIIYSGQSHSVKPDSNYAAVLAKPIVPDELFSIIEGLMPQKDM